MANARRRNILLLAALLLVVGGVAVAATRVRLLRWSLESALAGQGATDVRFLVGDVSPWRVVVTQLGFTLATTAFSAERVSVIRPRWWSPTLGSLRVEDVSVPVVLPRPAGGSAPGETTTAAAAAAPKLPALSLPFEEVTVTGRLVLTAGEGTGESLAIELLARRGEADTWTGVAEVSAPGLRLRGDLAYHPDLPELTWRIPEFECEAKRWFDFAGRIMPMPAGPWEVAGRIRGESRGRWSGETMETSAAIQLREARVVHGASGFSAEGLEADWEFTDLLKLESKPGSLRVRELRTGRVTFTDVEADVALRGKDAIAVSRVSARTLGGSIATEPFVFRPSVGAIDAVVIAEFLRAEQIMALTQDLPARVTGMVSGRLPVHYDENGVRFGTGWLGIAPGTHAEVQFATKGLLTAGTAPSSPSFPVLEKIETGLLRLQVTELRLEIRPPNAPGNRSAQLHVAGHPVSADVKAPVTLDLNVNGPLESLLNLGLKSGVSIGTKP